MIQLFSYIQEVNQSSLHLESEFLYTGSRRPEMQLRLPLAGFFKQKTTTTTSLSSTIIVSSNSNNGYASSQISTLAEVAPAANEGLAAEQV